MRWEEGLSAMDSQEPYYTLERCHLRTVIANQIIHIYHTHKLTTPPAQLDTLCGKNLLHIIFHIYMKNLSHANMFVILLGVWLGVEWDDTSRGKHSGDHQGVHYFSCRLDKKLTLLPTQSPRIQGSPPLNPGSLSWGAWLCSGIGIL